MRLDCTGRPLPGLAKEWTADRTGRTWTFTLRDGGRLRDGTPLTAQAVISAWEARQVALPGLVSATALDDKRLQVTLSESSASVPGVLADPTFSVAVDSGEGIIAFQFQPLPKGDPRDALDRGADLVVTRDPALVDYAANRSDFVALPLPWSRTYVLLQPPGAEPIRGVIDTNPLPASLVQDAVRTDARPAVGPFWWEGLPLCTTVSHVEGPPPETSRIVYPLGDDVARGLAERIVALANVPKPLRAAGLGHTEFFTALREQSERAFVIPAGRQTSASCREEGDWPSGSRILPLIDTRAHAIVRRGSPPLTVDWDGTVRVVEAAGNRDTQ